MWQFVLLRQLLLWLTSQTSISFMYYLQQSSIALYLDYINIQCMHVRPVTSVVSDFLWLDGPQSARFLCPGDSPVSLGYWSVLSYPPPGDLFNQWSNLCVLLLLHWEAGSLPLEPPQFSSVAQSCPTLCDPMNRSMPRLPVHHQLPEFTQTHVHRVGDAIQPSHRLSSPSPPAPNPSQHQGLFQWVNSSHEVAKVLEFQLQHQSFQWTPSTYLL